ncbi:MAG: hypothetical protein AABY22_34670 [Nanoarchaeota archaeon]
MVSDFNENITFYAFRYALGRKTYASFEVANYIIYNWDKLSEKTQRLIKKEIQEAVELGRAGMEMDERKWKQILTLNNK